MDGRYSEVGILEEILMRSVNRIRSDQFVVGRRYGPFLPYHAHVVVRYDIQEILEGLWNEKYDYDYIERRIDGVLTESLTYLMAIPTGGGCNNVPVMVEAGDVLEVNIEYHDLDEMIHNMLIANNN